MIRNVVSMLVLLPLLAIGQTKDNGHGQLYTASILHVTSVAYADDNDYCPVEACTAKMYYVDGYVRSVAGMSIEYKLRCREVTSLKRPIQVTIACADLHAGGDYNVKIYSFGIDFWKEATDGIPYQQVYEVVSEREVSDRHVSITGSHHNKALF